MTTCLPRWFALLVLVVPFIPVVAFDPDDQEIERLVKQLGSAKFKEREAATKRLNEIGEPALDSLRKATGSLEECRRAEAIVATIEKRLYIEQRRLVGHTAPVCAVVVSADGKRVLTSSDDKTLRLWDADSGKQLRAFVGHTGPVWGAALSPDGKRVLSGSHDGTVRLWDTATGTELHRVNRHALSVAFGPDGTALSGGMDGTMDLTDFNKGAQTSFLPGHTALVRTVAYSARAGLAATGSWDQSIRLWNLETGQEVRKLTGHALGIMTVVFSPDGKRLLSAAPDNTLRLWDVATGKEVKRIAANAAADQQAGTPSCAAFSPDGTRIASGSEDDHFVRVWDAATGKEVRKYEGPGRARGVAFFPDCKRVASASHDGTASIWRVPR